MLGNPMKYFLYAALISFLRHCFGGLESKHAYNMHKSTFKTLDSKPRSDRDTKIVCAEMVQP